MPQPRMPTGEGSHGCLFFLQGFVNLHRTKRLARLLGPTPGFFPQPAIVARRRNSQGRQRSPRRPTAALLGQLHLRVNLPLQPRWNLAMIFQT